MKRHILDDRPRVQVDLGGETRTKQAFKDECDINNIMAQYRQTGLIRHLAKGQPQYLDVSDVPDFRTALDHVATVSEFFSGLPAELRANFHNDPARFMDSLDDPETVEYLKRFGVDAEGAKTASATPEAPQEPTGGDDADKDPPGSASS